jgi:CRP/FNR family cyclic AMP-dependent transcriptional regulator
MPIFYDLFRNEPHIEKIKVGQALFRQGDAGNGLMYVLLAGHANILRGERVVEESRCGDILGELAMIEEAPRSASVIARTNCEFAVIDKKRFHWLVTETPGFATQVMLALANRLRHCDEILDG